MLLKRCLGERGTVVVLLKVARAGNDSPVSNIEGPNTHVDGSLPSVAIAAHGSREEGELSHGVNWLGGCAAQASPVHAFKRPVNLRRLRANHA